MTEAVSDHDLKSVILRKAQALLAQREHSAKMLTEKLIQKGFDATLVSEVIQDCQNLGYQSDQRFAEVLCRSRLNRGYGPYVIRQLLREAGIEHAILADVLEHGLHDWSSVALEVLEKKFKLTQVDVDSTKLRQKQLRFLNYRGFSDDLARDACDVYWSNLQAL